MTFSSRSYLTLFLGYLIFICDSSADDGGRYVLEEVTVTAQKREESLQETPISLVALTEDQLEVLGITSIENLQGNVPNLNINRFPQNNQTLTLFIRGVGLGDPQITQDPAVGVYIDGVYIARGTGLALDIADLEQVEVLRGPQGALYGRNATGGALNLITKSPQFDALSFKQTFSVGNQDLFQYKSSLNLPLSETTAVKVAWLSDKDNGYIKNRGPGGEFGESNARAGRIDFRWQPSDSFTLDYAYDWSAVESFNQTFQATRAPGVNNENFLLNLAAQFADRFVDFDSNRLNTLATQTPLLPTDTRVLGHALIVEKQYKNVLFKSITAIRELDDRSYIDLAGGAAGGYRIDFQRYQFADGSSLPAVRPHIEQEQFSQEFQWIGEISERADFIVGAYYFEEDALELSPLHHIFSFPISSDGLLDVLGVPAINAVDFDIVSVVNARSESIAIENEAWAIYGQFRYRPDWFAERLEFTFAWRHSEDSRFVDRQFSERTLIDIDILNLGQFNLCDTSVGSLAPPLLNAVASGIGVDSGNSLRSDICSSFDGGGKRSFQDDSVTIASHYQWNDDFNVYFKYAEAYKSGGFNIRETEEVFFARGFDEEKNRSLELGFKGELFDRRARLNGAIFFSTFDDFQLNFLIPDTISDTRVVNLDVAELSGLELDVFTVLGDGLMLTASYGYLDVEIDQVRNPLSGELETFRFMNAPRHTFSIRTDHTFRDTEYGTWTANLSWNFIDDRRAVSEAMSRKSHTLVNARLSLADIPVNRHALSVGVWGKNLFDSEYVSFAVDNLPHTSRGVQWGESRTWGMDVVFQY